MKKYLVFMMSLTFLSACSENLAVESMRRGIEAIEEGNFKEARSYLAFAQTEGDDPEYGALYSQIQSFLDMMDYLDQGKLDDALLSWTDLNLIETKSEVMKEVAVTQMQETLEGIITSCEKAIQTGEYEKEKGIINQVLKRLGDMEIFDEQMLLLRQLRKEMN